MTLRELESVVAALLAEAPEREHWPVQVQRIESGVTFADQIAEVTYPANAFEECVWVLIEEAR